MSARRQSGQSTSSATGPCRLSGFDAMNLSGALEQLEGVQGSLEAIRPRDARVTVQLQRLRGQLAELIGELRDLGGAQ